MYGQQITVPEQLKNTPSIFNNTGDKFLIQNRIPLTLILEPYTHFNQTDTSSTIHINNSYTDFKVILGRDVVAPASITQAYNVFGQPVTSLSAGDIHMAPNNGAYQISVPSPNPNDPPTVQTIFSSTVHSSEVKIDRIYDVFIESITTYNILPNTGKNRMAFILQIDNWNIDHNSNVNNISRSIVIPNEATQQNKTYTHKARKLNYLTYLRPDTISSISGRISFLNGENIFHPAETINNITNDHRICIELILIPRN